MIRMLPYFNKTRKPYRVAVAGFFLCLLSMVMTGPRNLSAQPIKSEIRIAVQEENPVVFVYHTALAPIGHGFNIYRKNPEDEAYTQLNEHPIRGVASGNELRAFLGTLYDDIELTTGQSTDNGTLTKLRSDFKTANLLTFIYPQIAEALGRLYIDRNAELDAPATYKIEFVDALDNPTGEVLEKTVLLLPQKPDAPAQLRAQNQGNLVTLFWRYIPPSENLDDLVIRFEAFRIDPTTNQHQRLHDKVILRNNALFEYSLTFEAPTVGQTEQLYVRSIDITGQESEASAILRYDAIDLDAPTDVIDLETKTLSNQRVQVSWKRSSFEESSADIAGFNIYRATELNNDTAYEKLNRIPLSANTSVFNDTLSVREGSQVYFYRITALDASGNEGPFSTAAMALVEDLTPPSAPSVLNADVTTDGLVSLTWDAEKPEDFDTYILLRRRLDLSAPAIPSRINVPSLTENTFLDKGEAGRGFLEGTTYRYSVISVDQTGNFSQPRHIDLNIPDNTAPEAPNGVQGVIENASRIAVFWNPSASDDVMSYVVYRRETGSSRLVARPVASYIRRFEDETVVSGNSYEYWVTAADSAGNESAQSAVFPIQMRDFQPPRSVRNVSTSILAEGRNAVQWEPVSAFDLAGYRVDSAPAISGNYEPVSENLITDTRWEDNNNASLDDTATRCYKVYAIDTSGNESKASQPACATSTESQ